MNDSYKGYSDLRGWKAEDFGTVTEKQVDYFSRELKSLYLPTSSRVLEIGFGNGSFLSYCRKRGWLISGVETNYELVNRARAGGFDAYQSGVDFDALLEAHQQSYDLIVAFDVFATIPLHDLPDMMKRMASLLKPSGILLARIPNGHSPLGRLAQHSDLMNKTVIGCAMAEQLGVVSGMQVIRLANPATSYNSNYAKAALQFLKNVIKCGIEIVVGHLYFNRVLPLDSKLIVIWHKNN